MERFGNRIAFALLLIVASTISRVSIGQTGDASDSTIKTPLLPSDTLPASAFLEVPPLGFSSLPLVPADNPMTIEKVRLGRRLFFDPVLSKDGTVSCASCHQPDYAMATRDEVAIGFAGQFGKRNSPSLINVGYRKSFFWDGRAKTLEEQALIPIESPLELASDVESALARLRTHAEYADLFAEAFAEKTGAATATTDLAAYVTRDNLAKAIACFERTLVAGNSPADRFHAADYTALSPAARQGMWLFESRGNCWQCHSGENFSDEDFHNTGVGFGKPDRDAGRFDATSQTDDLFKYKTASLRGVANTAPFMHDGSIKSLEEVVQFYSRGGSPDDPKLDPRIKPLNLSPDEIASLVEFLKALSN